MKKVITRNEKGGKTTMTYNGDGTQLSKTVAYKDKLGEVEEYWLPLKANPTVLELSSKTVTTEMGEEIKETYLCVKDRDPMCSQKKVLDRFTKLVLRSERGGDTFKFDYEFDSFGNWTKSTESVRVNKFGKVYFEPTVVRIREIKYY